MKVIFLNFRQKDNRAKACYLLGYPHMIGMKMGYQDIVNILNRNSGIAHYAAELGESPRPSRIKEQFAGISFNKICICI